jgi:lysophospholipase L1-like esterase
MVIHTFGDSHSYNGWGGIANIHPHHLGPKLCFSIGRDGINIKDGYNVNNGDTVIFCFGEIDCRCHVHKYITENCDFKQIIDAIVNNYFIQIKNAINVFKNLKTVIYNVVPPIQIHNTAENPEYPYLGTDEERKAYVLYFNQKLKEKCIEYNFLFFDVYNHYIDGNGFLNKSLSDDNVHIRDGTYIKQFVENHHLQ